MSNFSEKQENVRKYLLGTLDDEAELRRIEESIMLSDEFEDKISIAEDELIEEYLDGELSSQEAEKFKAFFLASPQRKEKFSLVNNLRRYSAKHKKQAEVPSEEKSQDGFFALFLSPAFLRFAVILVLISGIGFIIWKTAFYESDVDKGLAQMREIYKGTRLNESRSSFDSNYAPFVITRGSSSTAEDEKLDHAELTLRNAAQNSSDAQAHHALGLFYLKKKDFEKALNSFNAAQKLSPNDAKINSDIGAAYLEKAFLTKKQAKYDETSENLLRSQEAINRALQINPGLREALFNKALVLEETQQISQAIQTWQKYIEIETNSDWSNEAREKLKQLQQKQNQSKNKSQILEDFLSSYHQRDEERSWQIISQTKELITGVMVQQQLVKQFLENDQKSRKEEASEILSAFLYLGELEKRKTGDDYFLDLARFYSSATPGQKRNLLSAHFKLDESYKLILSEKFSEALENLEASRKLFTEADSNEKHIVNYQIAYCLSQQSKTDESNQILYEALAQSDENNFWLNALFYGWLGSNYSGLGDFSQAIAYDKKSLETAQKISDTYNSLRALNQLANEYRRIGKRSEMLSYGYRGMLTSDLYYLSPRQQFRNFYFFSQTSIGAGFLNTALDFSQENLNHVENNLKDNWLKHSATIQLATILGKIGKYQNSFDKFQESLEIASAISDTDKLKQLSALSHLSLANMQRESEKCSEANENYDRALVIYRSTKFSVNMYEAEKGKLLCDVKQNNEYAVRNKMPEIIKSFDDYRGKLREEERTAFFNVEQSVYDTAIEYFHTTLNDPAAAFNYSENSRSRTLLSLIKSGTQPQPLSLDEIRASMPNEVQLVYYTVLPKKLSIWHISKKSAKPFEKDIEQKKLFSMIDEYRKLLLSNSNIDETRQSAQRLYEALINPVESNLEANSAICFVGDKKLFQIPFSSLVSPKNNKYLIEDFSVMLAPSATVFIEQTAVAKQKNQTADETVLSIGNPSFSTEKNPDFADLPSAAVEARKVASMYDKKILLPEKLATKSAISNALRTVETVHFAGHYVPNFKNPSLSKFLLTAGTDENAESDLTVQEIIDQKLPVTKLIVLSACETGVENFYNGEGMIGAARAFLAADVPMVVASQWSVESDSTAELMVKFHNYRKRENLKTVEALRRAQIDLLSDEKSRFQKPYYWSGFSPIGGYAEY